MKEDHTAEDQALDELLGVVSAPLPPRDLADEIVASIRRQEAEAAYWHVGYKRAAIWASSSAAVICVGLFAWFFAAPVQPSEDTIAIDDVMVVDEVLDSIPDEALFLAICDVSDADSIAGEY